jgi:cyanophycinase-like exopeptidase
MAAQNGIAYFESLSAIPSAAMILNKEDADRSDLVQMLREGDVIYIAGGNPMYLLLSIRGTLAEEALRDHYQQDKLLVGSSAGAMLMVAKMASKRLDWQDSLGLIAGVGLLPHYEDLTPAGVAARRQGLESDITLLAIDTATCCVGPSPEGAWQVLGEGRVGVYTTENHRDYRTGESFSLDN